MKTEVIEEIITLNLQVDIRLNQKDSKKLSNMLQRKVDFYELDRIFHISDRKLQLMEYKNSLNVVWEEPLSYRGTICNTEITVRG